MARKKVAPLSPEPLLVNGGQLILNLTSHSATPELIHAGVVNPDEDTRQEIQRLLSFRNTPSRTLLMSRARGLSEIAYQAVSQYTEYSPYVIINPPVFLAALLESYLHAINLIPIYAYSNWEYQGEPDDTGRRKRVYHHAGFIEVTHDSR